MPTIPVTSHSIPVSSSVSPRGRLCDGLSEVDRAARERPVAVVGAADQWDLVCAFTTTTLTAGTLLLACCSSGES
jgi:hypothetical protein